MTTDWLLRVGNGENFIKGSKEKLWGIQDNKNNSSFIKNVKKGDRLWFIKGKSEGQIIGVANYDYHGPRVFGPLLALSKSNHELGWDNVDTSWTSDIEIHYNNLYNVYECNLLTHIQSPATIRKYNEQKCSLNLPLEYSNIVKYSKCGVIE